MPIQLDSFIRMNINSISKAQGKVPLSEATRKSPQKSSPSNTFTQVTDIQAREISSDKKSFSSIRETNRFPDHKIPSHDTNDNGIATTTTTSAVTYHQSGLSSTKVTEHFKKLALDSREWNPVGDARQKVTQPWSDIRPVRHQHPGDATLFSDTNSTAPPPGFSAFSRTGTAHPSAPLYKNEKSQRSQNNPMPESEQNVPIFHYFGGRSHGQRSFSLSIGAIGEPKTMMNSKADHRITNNVIDTDISTPKKSTPSQRFSGTIRTLTQTPEDVENSDTDFDVNQQPRSRSKSSSHIFHDYGAFWMPDETGPALAGQVDGRRISMIRDIWSSELPSIRNQNAILERHAYQNDRTQPDDSYQRRFSYSQYVSASPEWAAPNSHELASRYFQRDPLLSEHRFVD